MLSLHSILAAAEIVEKMPMLIGGAAGVLLVVAFIVGFLKGFRKVGWSGLVWVTAGGAFLLIARTIDINGNTTEKFVKALLIALGCIAATLVLYGVLARFLRPRARWVKDNVNGDTSLAEYGLEFEPEYLAYDGEDDPRPYGKRLYKTGFNPPNFAGRLLGGIACVLNVAVIIWAVVSVLLLGINATSLSKMNIGLVLKNAAVAKLLEFAQFALLDGLSIGLVILVAKKGYETGLMNSLRAIIVSLGSVAAVAGCFYLPFSPLASQESGLFYFLHNFVDRCTVALGNKVPFANILSKILAGACLSIVAGILMFLLNLLLKKCCRLVSANAPTRIVDKILSCALYMIIGAAICVGVWFILAILEHYGLFNISEVISEWAHLSRGVFNFVKALADKLLP